MNRHPMQKITAIVRSEALERVERHLEVMGVPGLSVMHIEGYGEQANFFREPPLQRYARLEIFAQGDEVAAIVEAIAESAGNGLAGDGIVAVSPVEAFYHISSYGSGNWGGYDKGGGI